MLSSTFIDDFGMRKLPLTAAEDLLEIIMRRYERCSTLLPPILRRQVDGGGITRPLDRQ